MAARKLSFLNTCFFSLALTGCYVSSALAADAAVPNPNFSYIQDGQPVTGWGLQLGDPENWSMPLEANRKGKSAAGKVVVETIDFKANGDALKIVWKSNKNIKGVFAIGGAPIDLSKFENEGALVFDIRLDTKPDKDVTIGMSCGYPCRGEMHVSSILKDLPKDEWTSLPIPLNCFTKEGLDIKKVSGPFDINTEGKLGLSITNVRLQKLPEGEKGCAKP